MSESNLAKYELHILPGTTRQKGHEPRQDWKVATVNDTYVRCILPGTSYFNDSTCCKTYILMESAQKRWIKIRGFNLLTFVVNNVKFEDGVQIVEQSDRKAA